MVTEAEEKVRIIRKNLEVAQARQRATMTKQENVYNLKWEIMCIARSHPLKVCKDLELKAN